MSEALPAFVRAVGWTSVTLAGIGVCAPRTLAGLAGVRAAATDSGVLPVLVRLAAARQGVIGLALLTRRPTDVRRAADLFLPLTVIDAGAVLLGVRQGALRTGAGALSFAVLTANAWVARRARL